MPGLERFLLLAAPIISILLAIAYTWMSESRFPALLPIINSGAILQTISTVLSLLLVNTTASVPIPGTDLIIDSRTLVAVLVIVGVILLLVLIGYMAIFQGVQRVTLSHINTKLFVARRIKLKPDCMDFDLLRQLAERLLDVDIRPSALSGNKRAKRSLLIDVINSNAAEDPKLTPDDLLLPPQERKGWSWAYLALGFVSILSYALALYVFIRL